jgi:tRNA threonylcarbamoyladenosine biosynthesis protein TsaB
VLTLAIDTSSDFGSLALLRDEQILGVLCTSRPENYSSRLFRQLEFLLDELGLQLPAVDLYSVVAGPGSFSGLRVGLAAVKGWAEVYEKPVTPVSALEAVAVQCHTPESWVVPVMDARRGQIFGALFERCTEGLRRHQNERVETFTEFTAWLETEFSANLQGDPAFISNSPELLKSGAVSARFAQCPVVQASKALAPYVGQLGLEQARRGRTVDALHLDANYVRRSDAELNLKAPAR